MKSILGRYPKIDTPIKLFVLELNKCVQEQIVHTDTRHPLYERAFNYEWYDSYLLFPYRFFEDELDALLSDKTLRDNQAATKGPV